MGTVWKIGSVMIPNPATARCEPCLAKHVTCPYENCSDGKRWMTTDGDTPSDAPPTRRDLGDGVIVTGPPS